MSKFHDELKRLHEAATPGPWETNKYMEIWTSAPSDIFMVADCGYQVNADITALLRNSVPKLLLLLEELDAVRKNKWAKLYGVEDALDALDEEV